MLLLHHHRHEEKKTNATRLRDARTKRREKNFLRPQDRRAQNSSRFYHPRPFRRRLRNDLRKKVLVYILLHHRSTSRSRRRTHSARARASSSFPLSFLLARFLRTKTRGENKRQSARAQVNCFLVCDRSERSQIHQYFIVHHHRSTLGEETEEEKPRVVVVFVVFESAHLLVFISVGAL